MCIRDRIIVTGDHETGGLTIGFAGTDYDTFLKNFENQKISYAKYDSDYVSGDVYKRQGIGRRLSAGCAGQ